MDSDDFVPDTQADTDFVPDTQQMGGKPPLGFIASKALGIAPWNKVNQAFKNGVGNFAEFAGKHTNLDPTQIGAALTPVAMFPEILGAATSFGGIQNSENPIMRGLTNTPEELGPQYAQGAETAGISGNLPEQRGAMARFPQPERVVPTTQPKPISPAETLPSVPPVSYPRDPAALVNFAKTRMDTFGSQLSPQELSDYKTMLGNVLDKNFNPSSPAGATASTVKAQATNLLNQSIPGRQGLNVSYGISKSPLVNPDFGSMASYLVKKLGWLPVKIALGAAGAKGLEKLFQETQ